MRTEQPPTVLAGRYVLERELGRSGIGMAWRANDRVLDRHVVVKLVRPELAQDPAFSERLTQELRAVALVSHPGLARVLDTGREDGLPFIVREYVEGESLRDVLEREGDVPAERAAAIIRSVLDALAAAHEAGVLHLDLKPENVLLSPDGAIWVCDLGVGEAVVRSRAPHEAAKTMGPVSLAPEEWAGTPPDARTDVWGAGALLYELLTRRPPTSADRSPRARRVDVPRRLDDLVVRALAPSPADRFETAGEFAAALSSVAEKAEKAVEAVRTGQEEGMAGQARPSPLRRLSIFRTWLAIPLLVAVVAGSAVAVGVWAGKLELGGPVGIRLKHEEPTPAPGARVLPFSRITAFDPFGDGHENDSGVPFAADGSTSTVWKSENYFDGRLNKPGVGLLFDLGGERTVTGFRLSTPYPGYAFAVVVGDDPTAMAENARATFTASSDMRGSIGPAAGRYVLLWITSVVATSDGNRAEVSEFRVVGTG